MGGLGSSGAAEWGRPGGLLERCTVGSWGSCSALQRHVQAGGVVLRVVRVRGTKDGEEDRTQRDVGKTEELLAKKHNSSGGVAE